MTKPQTQKEAINQLWDTVIGTNGDGLKAIAKHNQYDISSIKTDVSFIKGKLDGHMDTAKPSTKTITKRHVYETLIVAAVLGVCALAGIMIGFRLLTPNDIVRILTAWKGAG